ncbi:MAG TPA: hypothetical protein VFE14_15450 [Micromonosporaceae bacterium]|jgi:hypothetical protein|nr:hypothetical protein [Micromonosporaceae bacterium]
MSGTRLTTRHDRRLDSTAIAVIDAYLAELAQKLPAHAPLASDVAAELRGDLIEATEALAATSLSMVSAARAATAEFGDTDEVAAAFRPELAARQARRLGLILLVTGPLVGACWLATVFLSGSDPATAWRWLMLAVAPVLLIGTPATIVTVASTGLLARWLRPPAALTNYAAAVAGVAAGTLDVVLLAGTAALLILPVPAPSPVVALAAAASLARLVFVGRAAIRLLGGKPPFAMPSAIA